MDRCPRCTESCARPVQGGDVALPCARHAAMPLVCDRAADTYQAVRRHRQGRHRRHSRSGDPVGALPGPGRAIVDPLKVQRIDRQLAARRAKLMKGCASGLPRWSVGSPNSQRARCALAPGRGGAQRAHAGQVEPLKADLINFRLVLSGFHQFSRECFLGDTTFLLIAGMFGTAWSPPAARRPGAY